MASKSVFHRIVAVVVATLCAEGAWSLVPPAGFLFLTVNTGLAAYRARGDPWTLAFVVSAYANLLLLFWCLGAHERAPALDVPRRERLKLAILILSSTLNLSFSYHVSKILPFPLSVAVWSLAGIVTAAGFYLYFVRGGAPHDGDRRSNPLGDGSEKEIDALFGGVRDPAKQLAVPPVVANAPRLCSLPQLPKQGQ